MIRKSLLIILVVSLSNMANAEDRIELKTTTIKGNKELPKVLYIVPWKNVKISTKPEQELVLHSLFGDIFDPVAPLR